MAQAPTPDNLAFIETLYASFQKDPGSVAPEWRDVFDGWEREAAAGTAAAAPAGGYVLPAGPKNMLGAATAADGTLSQAEAVAKQHLVDVIVRNYRTLGHLAAQLDPLDAGAGEVIDELKPELYGLTEADLDKEFIRSPTVPGPQVRSARSLLEQMHRTYCRRIGVQFMHIDDSVVRQWLQWRMEECHNSITLGRAEQIRILSRLTDATLFEEFILKKFQGAKSFSLEGGESLIPMLDLLLEHAGEQGIKEIVVGMAHRGRLSVLCNVLGKPAAHIFREFRDSDPESAIAGSDVKYHMGYSGDWSTSTGKRIHLSMCFNPSHLEYVNAVALGRIRAKQDTSPFETRGDRGFALLIHGDAAFAGEGIVQETLQLSELDAYRTGGTVHIVVNNQVGFTTDPRDSRSTRYCTDVARMLQSPIFHVNGEDPEAVAQTVAVAMEFRQKFKRDVFIDLYCFRKRGHNETDEPRYTQPLMYRRIDAHPGVLAKYRENLLKLGQVTAADADAIAEARLALLEKDLDEAKATDAIVRPSALKATWEGFSGGPEREDDEPATGVPAARARELLTGLMTLPPGFTLNPKYERLWKQKAEMAKGEKPVDWAGAEALAFASLAVDGRRVRLTGQDGQRGTFSHRHAVLHDPETGARHNTFSRLAPGQAPVDIHNSALNESGVLGFEYGYSLDLPSGLVIWEAQFGDFANCAQVIIDQFITSAEVKWNRLSGITLLLPHGYEGAGPEHSSARLERFLQMCAEDNIQVCQPTTPAQLFHMLRRQGLRRWRKPLVVMTPKSLLRHPEVVSPLSEIESARFQRVLGDPRPHDRKQVARVLLCSGKIYFELDAKRQELKREDVAIVRVEQLYPFPARQLEAALAAYPNATEVMWVQDEPLNQGAWSFLHTLYPGRIAGLPLDGAGRQPSATPATGSKKAHDIEQKRLFAVAFGPADTQPLKGVSVQRSHWTPQAPAGKAAPPARPALAGR